MEPIYEEMAKKLANSEKNLVLAKMDSTANDSQEKFAVEGFPTIYFAPKGKKQDPIRYNGERSAEKMLEFMKTHAVASFTSSEKTEL